MKGSYDLTVNVQFGYDTTRNVPMQPSSAGEDFATAATSYIIIGGTNYGGFFYYHEFYEAINARAISTNAKAAAAKLPDPSGWPADGADTTGPQVNLTMPTARALGLVRIPWSDTVGGNMDGFVGCKAGFEGTSSILHELGRVIGTGVLSRNPIRVSSLEWYSYSAPGVPTYAAWESLDNPGKPYTYFSLDNGATHFAEWVTYNDIFIGSAYMGAIGDNVYELPNSLPSQNDITVYDAIGWQAAPSQTFGLVGLHS
jgi:hypothetical protein